MTNVLDSGKLAIRAPHIIVPDACVERCGKLAGRVGAALGKAAAEAETGLPAQRAVICDQASRLICHAQTLTEGFVQSDITQGAPDVLSANPTNPSPSQIIAEARQNGAVDQSIAEVFGS